MFLNSDDHRVLELDGTLGTAQVGAQHSSAGFLSVLSLALFGDEEMRLRERKGLGQTDTGEPSRVRTGKTMAIFSHLH